MIKLVAFQDSGGACIKLQVAGKVNRLEGKGEAVATPSPLSQ